MTTQAKTKKRLSRRGFLILSGVGVAAAAGLYVGFTTGRRYLIENFDQFTSPVDAEPNSWLEAPVRQLTQGPLTQHEREHLEALYEDELLSSLGLNSRTVAARFSGEGVQEAAISVWRELQRQAGLHGELGHLLRHYQSEQEKVMDATYVSLKNGAGGDQRKINLLDACDNHIREALPALMLFPETGLVRFLIDELEQAAGPDDGQQPGEHVLLEQLRQVNLAMSHSDLSEAGDWNRVRRILSPSNITDLPQFMSRRRSDNGKA